MTRKWTKNQNKAIYNKPNILVNAAAGSGKTAVLVERIINKLIPDENGVYTDIDRLLIVTFARAAAAEMAQRINDALNKYIKNAKTNEEKNHYKKQQRLISHSDITTIDAFCVKTVRNHFHLLGIDPNFSIMDEIETEILKDRVIEELFDELFESEDNEEFLNLIDMYCTNQSYDGLKRIILDIYKFTRSLPNPDEWIKKSTQQYSYNFKDSFWFEYISEHKNAIINECISIIEIAIKEACYIILGDEVDDVRLYLDNILPKDKECLYEYWDDGFFEKLVFEYELLNKLLYSDWDYINESINSNFDKMRKSSSKKEVFQNKNIIIEIRKNIHPYIDKLREYYSLSEEENEEIFKNHLYPVLKSIENLLNMFIVRLSKIKHDSNTYEFNDLEHLCLKLFCEFENVREEYKQKYEEILMDEYQDTNGLQERIFSVISKDNNRFMVGDIKQSIYGFRNSDPNIFKQKDDLYRESDSGERIILSENFRSRHQVLDSVNEIFSRVMSESCGSVTYDESQMLKCGNLIYEQNEYLNQSYKSELYIIEEQDNNPSIEENEDETDEDISDSQRLSNTRIEARFVANKIKELLESEYKVLDGDKFRNIKMKDIAILSSSVKNVSGIYLEELLKLNISGVCENIGYFKRSEIKLIMNLIRIINNPLQDIPLIAVLRSPLFRFTEEELVKIRLCFKGEFYFAMKQYVQDNGHDNKTGEFLRKLKKWRSYTKYMSADKLIWTLYTETMLYDMAAVLYGDEEAQANLRLLFDKARAYEKSGFKGLFNFIRFIERIEKSGSDISGAKLVNENHDVVRIMTIHKSKGLEFPVVFVVGTGKKILPPKGADDKITMHKDFGFGMEYISSKERFFCDTVSKAVLKDVKKQESKSEEMRKLYVGLTRPKEKLIVTATVKGRYYDDDGVLKSGGVDEAIEKWKDISKKGFKSADMMSINSFTDWMVPAILSNENNSEWDIIKVPYEQINDDIDINEENIHEETDITDEQIRMLMEHKYMFNTELPSKISVSQIKHLYNEQNEDFSTDDEITDKYTSDDYITKNELIKMPQFMQETKITGAMIGTAYHNVFALIDLSNKINAEYIQSQIQKLIFDGIIQENVAKKIDVNKIYKFYCSDIGKEMICGDPKREQPFLINISEYDIYKKGDKDNNILLQGVIDCYYTDSDGNIILIDYKTDKCDSAQQLIEKYTLQLEWYKRALERILNKKVSKVFIYSLFLDKSIKIL